MYRCPKCEDSEILIVDATVDASVDADGNLESLDTNLRFEPSSHMFCGACGFSGSADQFMVAEKAAPQGGRR